MWDIVFNEPNTVERCGYLVFISDICANLYISCTFFWFLSEKFSRCNSVKRPDVSFETSDKGRKFSLCHSVLSFPRPKNTSIHWKLGIFSPHTSSCRED